MTINPLSVTIDSMTKITELKKAANLYTDTSGRWANSDGVDRLVELVVRECMDITKQCSTGNGIHDLFADEIIAQHFGVGE